MLVLTRKPGQSVVLHKAGLPVGRLTVLGRDRLSFQMDDDVDIQRDDVAHFRQPRQPSTALQAADLAERIATRISGGPDFIDVLAWAQLRAAGLQAAESTLSSPLGLLDGATTPLAVLQRTIDSPDLLGECATQCKAAARGRQ